MRWAADREAGSKGGALQQPEDSEAQKWEPCTYLLSQESTALSLGGGGPGGHGPCICGLSWDSHSSPLWTKRPVLASPHDQVFLRGWLSVCCFLGHAVASFQPAQKRTEHKDSQGLRKPIQPLTPSPPFPASLPDLQPHWPLCCSSNQPGMIPTAGLFSNCSLCLESSFLGYPLS